MSNKPTKEPWDKKVGEFIGKVGRFLRSVWDILYKVLRQAIDTINYLIILIIRLLLNPSSTVFFCLFLLAVVTIVTMNQWWQIGLWIGRIGGVVRFWGWSVGLIGMGLGLFINVEELAPELHKISTPLAKAFKQMGVKTDFVPEPDNFDSLIADKPSYDMSLAKKGRIVSYFVETAIVITFIFATGLTLQSIVLAVISLVCPEMIVKYTSSKTELFGTGASLAAEIEDNSPVRNFGGSPKSGRGGSSDIPGGGGVGKPDRF